MQPSPTHESVPGLDGPDYLALVIEWNDDDTATLVVAAPPDRAPAALRKIAAMLGALSALVVVIWGVRHLRAAA